MQKAKNLFSGRGFWLPGTLFERRVDMLPDPFEIWLLIVPIKDKEKDHIKEVKRLLIVQALIYRNQRIGVVYTDKTELPVLHARGERYKGVTEIKKFVSLYCRSAR